MKPDFENLPLHTNKVTALQKEKRKKASSKSLKAVEEGDVQAVIDSLTGKQRQFCEEYLKDLNATQAVLRAGYQTRFPNRVAFQLMENPAIRISIDALRAERGRHTDVTKDYVLQNIKKTIEKAIDDNNHNATLRGLELLARHLGMFIERTEISGPEGNAIELRKIEEDVADFTSAITRLARRGNTESGTS